MSAPVYDNSNGTGGQTEFETVKEANGDVGGRGAPPSGGGGDRGGLDPVDGAGTARDPRRHPPRDVDRDPDAPSLRAAAGTWPSPEDGEAGAIVVGEGLYAVGDKLAVGTDEKPGHIPRKERAATRLRNGTVAAERAAALRPDEEIQAGAPTQEQIQLANGMAANAEHNRIGNEDVPRREEALEDAKAELPDAKAKAKAANDLVAEGDQFEQDDSLIQKVAAILPVEIVVSAILMLNAVSARIKIPVPVIGPLLVALGLGAAMTTAAVVVGAILNYVLPKKGGGGVLLALAGWFFAQLVGHLADLRLEKDDGPLALGDVQLLMLVAAAFTGWALMSNLGFAAVRRARDVAEEAVEEAEEKISAGVERLDQAREARATKARYTAETFARVLTERRLGLQAGVAIKATNAIYDGVVESEEGHGVLRETLGIAAYDKARNERLREPGEGPAEPESIQERARTTRPAVWAAIAALLVGGTLGIALGSALPPATGAVLAALALLLGLRRKDVSPPDEARDPEGTVRPLTQPRRPWVRMPKRQTGGRDSANASSNTI